MSEGVTANTETVDTSGSKVDLTSADVEQVPLALDSDDAALESTVATEDATSNGNHVLVIYSFSAASVKVD